MADSNDLVARVLTLRNQVNEVVCFNDAQSADKAYALETLDQVIIAISPTIDEDVAGDPTCVNGLDT